MNERREPQIEHTNLRLIEPKDMTFRLILSFSDFEQDAVFREALGTNLVKLALEGDSDLFPAGYSILLDNSRRIAIAPSEMAKGLWFQSPEQLFDDTHAAQTIEACSLLQNAVCKIADRSASADKDGKRLYAAIPVVQDDGEMVGTYVYAGTALVETCDESRVLSRLYAAVSAIFTQSALVAEQRKVGLLRREIHKQEMLVQSAKRLHALIDTDSVLAEIVSGMTNVFPEHKLEVYLSQDNQSSNMSVKPLDFQRMENSICTRAFMDGEIIIQHNVSRDLPSMEMAVPLSGKQGVYGVLHLQSNEIMEESDIQIVRMLADIGGPSFENAKLYEQSYMLINELRLINEITQRLNQSLSLNEIFSIVSSELFQLFGAEYFSIMQRDKNSDRLLVQASNLPEMFHQHFTIHNGFSGVVFATKEPVIISDYWVMPKVKSKLMELTGSRSLIASPIIVKGEVMGAILIVHHKPNYFSYDNYKLLQMLSGHIGLAMTNASLHAEVKRMVVTDNLTGLYVRHFLDEQISLAQKKDFCGSFILIDLDNFKRINDTYGHQVGDQVLMQVSSIIKSSIRENDIAARWGGEELAVYFPQITKEQSTRIADRIRMRVMKDTNPIVTISCGVSDWNWEDEKISVETLFYKADMAMYQAKNTGKNQIIIDSA